MGKTADLTVVQKQSLTPFTRRVSHNIHCQRSWLFTECCIQAFKQKVEWKEKVWKENMQTNRENRSLMRIVKQNRFKNLGELHKNGLRLGSGIKSHPHRRVKEFGYSCRQRRLFLKTNITAPIYQEFWSTSCFLLLTSFLKMLISFSSRFGTCPTAKAPKVG